MIVLLVINPKAGSSNKISFVEKAKTYAKNKKVDLEIYWTNGKTDEEKIAQIVEKYKIDRIIAAGGDGTVRMTAIAIKKSNLLFGIVPLGTSNGLATDLEIPKTPIEALIVGIESNKTIDFDFIRVNEKDHLLHIGDIGANANLIKRFEKDPEEGYVTYSKHLIDELQNLGSFNYKIDCNGQQIEGSAQMIAFCNARKFGSGVPLTLSGHPGDGKFEIVIYKEINFATLVKSTLSTINEDFFDLDHQKIIECKSASIKLSTEVPMQLDGELCGKTKKVHLQIDTNQLKVICTSDCPY